MNSIIILFNWLPVYNLSYPYNSRWQTNKKKMENILGIEG